MTSPITLPNPWLTLPDCPPYIAREDLPFTQRYNAEVDDRYRLRVDALPEPYLGNPDAPVVLLNHNPGFTEGEDALHHLDGYFRAVGLANLRHEPLPLPFYFLDPTKRSPGHDWWQKRLGSLIELYGPRVVANNVFCVEYFPYHSKRFGARAPSVPSQEYSFELVRRAVERAATIIVMRSEDLWLRAVPALRDVTYYKLNSTQSVYVTANNTPYGYAAACEALSRAASATSVVQNGVRRDPAQ
jgi:hypothetical protein